MINYIEYTGKPSGLTNRSSAFITINPGFRTKSSWQEIEASLPYDIDGFSVISFWSLKGSTGLYDVGIGSSGNEVVLIANLRKEYFDAWQGNDHRREFFVPIPLKAGTRIAMRGQGRGSDSDTCAWCLLYYSKGTLDALQRYYGISKCLTIGANAGDLSCGYRFTVGASWSWGSIHQITSGISKDIKAFSIIAGFSDYDYISSTSTYEFRHELFIGPSGSEIRLKYLYYMYGRYTEGLYPTSNYFIPIPIKAGTRLSIRGTTARSEAEVNDITIYGWY